MTDYERGVEQASSVYKEVIREYVVENAKLMKLVRVMAYCMQHERDCDGCAMNGADGAITALSGCDGLLDRLRELGVEV